MPTRKFEEDKTTFEPLEAPTPDDARAANCSFESARDEFLSCEEEEEKGTGHEGDIIDTDESHMDKQDRANPFPVKEHYSNLEI